MRHVVEFVKSGRGKAQCAPNPEYPNGILIDGARAGEKSCAVDLPYPAPECGVWRIQCEECWTSVLVTAAGRPDDPRRVIIPCGRDDTPGKDIN